MARQSETTSLADRRKLGSVRGLFPVLRVDGTPIHESLAICEYVADAFPDARPLAGGAAATRRGTRNLQRDGQRLHEHAQRALVPLVRARADVCADARRASPTSSVCSRSGTRSSTRSGGPFLFGRFSIADAMYFPVLTRFRTYGVRLPSTLVPYAAALETHPAVLALIAVASSAPRIPVYDDYLRRCGGDPDAGLRHK